MSCVPENIFCKKEYFVWKVTRPFKDRPQESPAFIFMNSEWNLKIIYVDHYYCLVLTGSAKETAEPFKPFWSTVIFQNSRNLSDVLFCRKKYVHQTPTYVWQVNRESLSREISDWDDYSNFTLLCIFEEPNDFLSYQEKTTKHKSVQTTFEFPLACDGLPKKRKEISPASVRLSVSLDSLSADLRTLLDSELLPDVQLKIGDHLFPAHKAVLVARSKVFAAMFQHQMAESTTNIVDIQDFDPSVFPIFIKYIYTGHIYEDSLTGDSILKLYEASDKYAVAALKTLCSESMMKSINEDNFLSFLVLADNHSDLKFRDAVASFIAKDDSLFKCEIWKEFATEKPQLANEIYLKYFEKNI